MFYTLSRATGDASWAGYLERGARAIANSGIPELETPGFWDNAGQCCGCAGVAEHFLSLYELTGRAEDRAFAHRLADDLLRRASPWGADAVQWVHAENRVEPYWRRAYTGYFQGAAGIGSLLIRLADRTAKFRLPCNPLPL